MFRIIFRTAWRNNNSENNSTGIESNISFPHPIIIVSRQAVPSPPPPLFFEIGMQAACLFFFLSDEEGRMTQYQSNLKFAFHQWVGSRRGKKKNIIFNNMLGMIVYKAYMGCFWTYTCKLCNVYTFCSNAF